ncbi:MAG: GNAT family N-acetyltransferase, partial [Armatimonadota bacterium]|nr:GNAT family N-acetyltransferase [Armatimonadota bacterium]
MKAVVVPIGEFAVPDAAALPPEWQAWAEEPGRAVLLQDGEETVGVVCVAVVGRGEAWLEGLWVRPAARGTGVGRRLVAEAEVVACSHGATLVRTAVPARDYAALAVAERGGFARLCEAVVLVAGLPASPMEMPYDAPVRTVAPDEAPALAQALLGAESLAGWRGLVPLGWRFRRIVPELVRGLAKDRRALRAGAGGEGAALFALRGETAVISALAGPTQHRQALVAEIA